MKPMLAEDFDPAKLRFPLWAQPKIDGVRGLNMTGSFTGRSLKAPKNLHTTGLYSQPCLAGFDGEVAAERETHPDLCRITSSKIGTILGEPFTLWWLFDFVVPGLTTNLPYRERYKMMVERAEYLKKVDACRAAHNLRVVPYIECGGIEALNACEESWLEAGYEGVILRDPNARHKQGRSTVIEGGLLRIKRFVDAEAVVIRYVEGNRNDNVAQTNELGKTFRTSHAENLVPNGQVGTIVAKDVVTGKEINVGPGDMDIPTRRAEWFNRDNAPGKVFTYKTFPKGVKDKPRFPTWKFWRDVVDMSR